MSGEKRRAPRYSIDQMIELSMGREQAIRCRGMDISAVGILCHLDTELEPGTRVFLMLHLGPEGEGETVSCEGVVVRNGRRAKGCDAGIEFSDLDAASRRKLGEFLARQTGP